MSNEAHVFISYARRDGEFALRLGRDLRSEGVNIWLDQLDIPAGAHWDRVVQEALETCECLLIILSPASVASVNVMDEVAFAFERKKRIVPVLYRRCEIPLRLLRLQYIDFISDYNQGLAALLVQLQETKTLEMGQAVALPPAESVSPPVKRFPWSAAAIVGAAVLLVLAGIFAVAQVLGGLPKPTPTTVATTTATFPVAMPTPGPTATSLPPTVIHTPMPTDTPTPTPTSTNTPTPIPTSTPTSTPTTPHTPMPTATIGPSFGEMSLCLKDEFNEAARRCETSRTTFTGQVESVYVSWTYSNVYVGVEFGRKWYWNNQLISLPDAANDVWDGINWETDGVSEYTWLEAVVFGERYFPPGSYIVELYIGDRLEQRSDFTVR